MEANVNVHTACQQLLFNLDCVKFHESPYFCPFVNYLSRWPHALPIKTILIGQNPYPQPIYPVYGAALSYDDTKVTRPPGSVKVIAEDLFNYDGTDREDTIACFRDLWMMTDVGVIAINETVFAKIVESEMSSNLRPTKEAEYQVRALQTLIAESYLMGQRSIQCVAMGMSAAMMSSLLRGWCPNDLITIKIVTCTNPAAFARHLGDLQSQSITIGNNTVSKILSSIVKQYTEMPPKREDKRIQQNEDSLKKITGDLVTSTTALNREYSTFAARLSKIQSTPEVKATLDDMSDSMHNLVESMDRCSAAINSQTIAFLMAVKTATQLISKDPPPTRAASTVTAPIVSPQIQVPTTPVASARPVRRRVSRAVSEVSTPQVESIKEEASDAASEVEPQTPTPLRIASGRTRRIVRRVSQAPSIADSDYTVADSVQSATTPARAIGSFGQVEKVHMRSIANWIGDHMGGDTTYSEMLEASASELSAMNSASRDTLKFIESRMAASPSYDAYSELEQSDSETTKWCTEYISKL